MVAHDISVYILLAILLIAVECCYILVARRHGWFAERCLTMQQYPTPITGGGIIFYISMLLWVVAAQNIGEWAYFTAGLTLLAGCSFADDIKPTGVWTRLGFHAAAAICLGVQCQLAEHQWVIWPAFIICVVGFINSCNFMDGINGMTIAYSIAVMGLFMYIDVDMNFIPLSFLITALISVLIFSFFNFRNRAIAFAGDIGSVCMGFIMATVMCRYIMQTHQLAGLIMVSVYGVDTVMTIIRRAIAGENVLQPHQKHVYQLVTNIWSKNPLLIATSYAILQLLISIGYLQMTDPTARLIYFLTVLTALILAYIAIVSKAEKKSPVVADKVKQ